MVRTPEKQRPPQTALTELPRLIKEVGKEPDAAAAYDIPWIEHIAGDVHQPLHCIGRFLKSTQKSDQGGNLVFVAPRGNLHGLWDGAAGTDTSDAYVTKYAAEAVAEHLAPSGIEKNPRKWIAEGAELARTRVYTFGLENGGDSRASHPSSLIPYARKRPRRVARVPVAVAGSGYRLAAVHNEHLCRRENNRKISGQGWKLTSIVIICNASTHHALV